MGPVGDFLGHKKKNEFHIIFTTRIHPEKKSLGTRSLGLNLITGGKMFKNKNSRNFTKPPEIGIVSKRKLLDFFRCETAGRNCFSQTDRGSLHLNLAFFNSLKLCWWKSFPRPKKIESTERLRIFAGWKCCLSSYGSINKIRFQF